MSSDPTMAPYSPDGTQPLPTPKPEPDHTAPPRQGDGKRKGK